MSPRQDQSVNIDKVFFFKEIKLLSEHVFLTYKSPESKHTMTSLREQHQQWCEIFHFMHRKMQQAKHLLILMTSLLFFGNLVYAQLSKF